MLTTSQNNGGSTIFLSITNGKLVRRVDLGTEGAVERTNKNGKQVAELFYTTLTGHITDLSIKENEYGKFLLVNVKDIATEKKCVLEMNFSSGYTTTFLKALPTADISQNIEISPALIIDGDKKKSVIFLKQGGYPVKHFYTKDNPKGMPDMVKVKVKGKETWDDTDRIEWLYNKAKALFVDVPF
jgi:hypothetical protein